MTQPSLTDFLLARLAEAEAEAQGKPLPWGDPGVPIREALPETRRAEVLADVKSKRRVVELMSRVVGEFEKVPEDRQVWPSVSRRERHHANEVLLALALPYAKHPDYPQDLHELTWDDEVQLANEHDSMRGYDRPLAERAEEARKRVITANHAAIERIVAPLHAQGLERALAHVERDNAAAKSANPPSSSPYMTTAEVASLLRAPAETVRYWRHVGTGPKSFKLGRRVLYAVEDVEAFIAKARKAGES